MKGTELTNMVYAFNENRNNPDRLINKKRILNSNDLVSNKLTKSKNFLLEKIKSSSANSFEKLAVNPNTSANKPRQNPNHTHRPGLKKINLAELENKQESDFAKVSYRLKNFQYFEDKPENASDFQKREVMNNKQSKNQLNGSLNSLHISHLNLDSSLKVRGQSRNRSASNELFIAPISKINNTNNQVPRGTIQKNYIDLNIQGPSYQSQSNNFFNQTPNYQLVSLYQPTNRVQSSKSNHHLKIINDSNKFLEDVLAHSKRKTLNYNQFANSSYQTFYPSNSSSSIPNQINTLVINRSLEEKNMFPDKLILDRRKLNFCPKIEGEDTLKLINYQHNQIRSIQNMENMKNLIFLDLYDNRIEKITGLTNLINLRVLMLGKNKIQKIENLDNLAFLDILDLHGNLITKIENLHYLNELRVLNIAANEIKVVENLSGLNSLVELNLRRNKIEEIKSIDNLQKLQRLFLSHNQIASLTWLNNMNSNIQELTLDNNPIYNESNYRVNLLAMASTVRKLDSKRVTENERRMAYSVYSKDIAKTSDFDALSRISARIQDAENDWIIKNQLERSASFIRDLSSSEIMENNNDDIEYDNVSFTSNKLKIVSVDDQNRKDKKNNFINTSILNSSCSSTNSFKDYVYKNDANDARIMSASSNALRKNISNPVINGKNRIPAQNNCSAVQQDNIMFFYGVKSLEILETKIDQSVQNQITTLSFHFIDYDEMLAKNFLRLKNKFPNTLNLVFTCCNIKNLNQLYSLLDWKRLDSISINKEDNPVDAILFWKYFVNNYLHTLQIKKVNNNQIARSETCQKMFSGLSSMLYNLPDFKLMRLLKRERKKIPRPVTATQTNDDDDICNTYKNEHNNNLAKEQMFKSFCSYAQSDYSKMLSMENQTKQSPEYNENNPFEKMSTKIYSQNFVNMLLKQMNHNDSRKKKFNQIKNRLWITFVENSIHDVFDTKSHIDNICEKYKIIL